MAAAWQLLFYLYLLIYILYIISYMYIHYIMLLNFSLYYNISTYICRFRTYTLNFVIVWKKLPRLYAYYTIIIYNIIQMMNNRHLYIYDPYCYLYYNYRNTQYYWILYFICDVFMLILNEFFGSQAKNRTNVRCVAKRSASRRI